MLVRNTSGGFADWPGGNEVAMTKGEDGVWSATIGPLKPEYYVYVYVVDGVQTLDPQRHSFSMCGTADGTATRFASQASSPGTTR